MYTFWRIPLLLCWLCVACMVSGCENSPAPRQAPPPITHYTNIPGITQAEIDALEALKKEHPTLSFGMALTTEAFYGYKGKPDGFVRLVTEHLEELLGMPVQAKVLEWDALVNALHSHRLDLTGELSPTPERHAKYLMTTPFFNRIFKIFTNKNNPPLADIAKERPLQAGFLKGTTSYGIVKSSWQLPFVPQFMESEADILDGLEQGTLDVYIDEGSVEAAFQHTPVIHSQEYYPLRYSPLSITTANPQLKPVIDVLQRYFLAGGLVHIAALHKQGQELYMTNRLENLLTNTEKLYIKQHSTQETAVLIGAENENYPISFYNPKEQQFQGIAVDVLDHIARLSGLQVRIANNPNVRWPELLQQLGNGKISLVTELVPTEERNTRFIWPNYPYNTDYFALISRADFPNQSINDIRHAKVGLLQDTAASELFSDWFPDHSNIVVFHGADQAYPALEKGEIDLLMQTESALLSFTNYLEKPGFKANFVFQYPSYSNFGLHKDEIILRSILDKVMPLVETDTIAEHWKRKVFDYNSKMLKDTLPYIIAALVLLGLGLGTVATLLAKNRRLNRNLEAIVEERTSQLVQANRAKSDFLSIMSHEIRTPMNAIMGMAQIAEKTNEVSKLKYCLNSIKSSSIHLLGLLNDILDMSKIEAGKLELHNAPVYLENVFVALCTMFAPKAEEKGQTLLVEPTEAMCRNYVTDELRLSQVLTNLVGNAIKFTPEGGTITLSVQQVETSGANAVLVFAVKDTGIGLTQEQIDRLFSAFTQADSSIASRFGGTGLGLAISKSIVNKMGGHIGVQSQPEQGATFFFEVPLQPAAQPSLLEACPGTQAGLPLCTQENKHTCMQAGVTTTCPVLTRTNTMHLVLVSQDPTLQAMFSRIAALVGFSHSLASSAQEVSALLKENIAQAKAPAVTAVLLHACKGPQSLLAVQEAHAAAAGLPCALVSPSSQWTYWENEATAMGISHFLALPLLPSPLLACLSALLPAEQAEQQATLMSASSLAGLRLLLVEDLDINREIFTTLIEPSGIHITTAENGQEALNIFSQNQDAFDVIVMDVQMPVMNGYEATRAIRALGTPAAKNIPIIAMTANAFTEDVQACLASGMNDHAMKPIDTELILAKIQALVHK
ncbi:ATP-binding protein [Desulfovibrio cuneatus]|uniref:ATP-binding protein n=1 Tax=Desulfovibrio cuneatus TaxID=159728 RepID=UPI0004191A0B|nr:transporter substrate-binding domain-containing protein [Desulfovibrio cuneatus]